MSHLSIQIVEDTVDALRNTWSDSQVKRPHINAIYDRRVRGLGTNQNENILIYNTSSHVKPFDLQGKTYQVDLPVTVEINTNISATRFKKLCQVVFNTLVNNIEYAGYIRWINRGMINNSYRHRNYFQGIMDFEAMAIYKVPNT